MSTTTIENRTFKGLRAVEEEGYNSVKHFDACDKEYRAKEEQDEIAKRKAEQEKREANREHS